VGDWASANGRLLPGAKWYAENLGWHVLPVHGIDGTGKCTCGKSHNDPKEVGKHPAAKRGQSDATTDLQQIDAWWQENENYNVGVFARPSGFFVIDIDPRSGGDKSFETLVERAMGELPPTVEAITGEYYDKGLVKRGRHLIYKCDPEEKFIGNLKAEGLSGIDIKHNGYILIAPSRHFSGVTYEWKPGHEPWNMQVAEASEELLAVVRARSLRKRTTGSSYEIFDWSTLDDLSFGGEKLDIEKMMAEGLVEGQRAVGLYQIACGVANKIGVDTEFKRNLVETTMLRFNAEAVNPPMELEGPNSVLMHTRRAIQFVSDNPKIDLYWSELSEWVKSQGVAWVEGVEKTFVKSVDAKNAFKYELDDQSTLDLTKTPNAIGTQVASYAAQGRSLKDVALGGNLLLPKDVDALSHEAGGRPEFRSLSDVGNGRRLVDSFGSTIRYTPNIGWFIWDGNYWKPDNQMKSIKEVTKMVSTVIASETSNYGVDDPRAAELVKHANKAKSNSAIENMIAQASSDERIQVPVEDWDNNPYLLGVKNGVIDLKTGELKAGRPDLHLTKRSPIAYTQGMRNVRWETFLAEATHNDPELINWLQLAVGYTLTGLNSQDIMFLIYGPPGSGKNTFIETVFEALGSAQYAWALDSNILALGDRISSTDEYHMAELRGRRMIWVDELPESERIKENQVKKLTGSGTIQGRSPGERPIQFTSQGKLWISTNHRPIITDDAMWRRMRPIPLTNKPEKPDVTLKPYLADPEGALPAVLAWAVEGAVKYLSSSQTDPLGWCSVVKEAHDLYKKNEDRIGAFLEEEAREAVGQSLNLGELFRQYRIWSEYRGERPLTQIGFTRKLADRGLKIEGTGSKARLMGHTMMPREVPDLPTVDYSQHTRYVKTP
jgi:P4 family phage/plasmid primase-like protien